MPDSAIAAVTELAADSHSVITRSQAAAHLSNERIATAIRQGWLTEPYPGVICIAGSVPTFEHRLRAATVAINGHACASHRSAARLHGLDGWSDCEVVEVTTDRLHRWQFDTGVVSHHLTPLEPVDLTEIGGIAVTTLARTLADLGSVVNVDQLAQALTSARRSGCSLHWLRRTAERLDRPGQPGTSRLLRLLDAIPFEGRVPGSWFEELLARCLDDPRLPALVPQYEICTPVGEFVARVDFAIPHVKLAIEAHSRRHHFGPLAEARDADRDLRAAACGWEMLYVGWHAMKHPADVVSLIADVVAARSGAR
ncbi:MAG: hypothetical protein ABJH68_15140 [Ilumatobacter sp.]|uniref:hypothetical protein n=1 Tax=Ilumatobacter sp. TaxID=1967498 RepID=UPI003298106C